jgi:polysaccharide chain length determinant protein (PEP-CTERM system associated)
MEERTFDPLDYVSVLKRRKWWFITPLVVCLAGGTLLALLLPRTYYSQAEIGVASPTLSPELLRSVQSMDANERRRAVSQQLLSRTVLERVVREEQLAGSNPVEEVAAGLRSRVVVDVPKPLTGDPNKNGLDSFYLGYMDSTAEKTARVANRLAVVFVEENSKTRTERAENTAEVLGRQLKASQDRLAVIEEQLRLKKEANMGRLPNQIDTNVQMVNGLRSELASLSTTLRGDQDRLTAVEAELQQMRQGSTGMPSSSSLAALHAAQSRINQLQQELTQARAVYKDKHPEIGRLQDELKQARADLSAVKPESPGERADLLASDPLYRQKIAERDNLRSRIKSTERAEANARAQISQFQSAVAAAPRVEQDLFSLTREAQLENDRYADLKKKHEAALDAENVSRTQGGERFSVLYAAGMPTEPLTPNVVKLMLMALALGLALGVGLVIGREFLDRSVHDARALQSEFELPVLGEIPRIHRVS